MSKCKLVGIIIVLLTLTLNYPQTGSPFLLRDPPWFQTYGGSGYEYAFAVIQTTDSGFALVGVNERQEIWLVKTDATGVAQWNQSYGYVIYMPSSMESFFNDNKAHRMRGPPLRVPFAAIQTPDGGFALATTSYESVNGVGNWNFWLVKTDDTGVVEWNQTYDYAISDRLSTLISTSDGGFALAGMTVTEIGGYDFWLLKTDATGVAQWNQTYGYEVSGWDYASTAVQTTDGGYALAGGAYAAYVSEPHKHTWLLIKTDSTGVAQWNQSYNKMYHPNAIVQTSDEGFAFLDLGFGLMKTDATGMVQWEKRYRAGYSGHYSLIQTADGGYTLTGGEGDYMTGNVDAWLVKTDATGEVEWNQTYGGSNYDATLAVIQTTDGGFALAGGTKSYGAGSSDCLLIRTDTTGTPPIFDDIEASGLELLPLVIAVIGLIRWRKKYSRKNERAKKV